MRNLTKKKNAVGAFLLIGILLLISSCGTTKLNQHPALASSGPGSATVHILRGDSIAMGCCSSPVTFNGEKVLEIKNATYTTVYLKPGSYEVRMEYRFKLTPASTSRAGFSLFKYVYKRRSFLPSPGPTLFVIEPTQIELAAGRTYYIVVKTGMLSEFDFLDKIRLVNEADGEGPRVYDEDVTGFDFITKIHLTKILVNKADGEGPRVYYVDVSGWDFITKTRLVNEESGEKLKNELEYIEVTPTQ